MDEDAPYKRQRAPHDSIEDEDSTKRPCLEQSTFLDASRLHEATWLTPTISSSNSHRNSASPYALSNSGSPFLPPSGLRTARGNVPEDDALESSSKYGLCCFGELLIDFMSSAKLCQESSHVPVELRFSNDTISLHIEGSGKYVGLIESKAIEDLVQTYQVTLTTTLSWSPTSKKKSTEAIQTSKTLHIVVYGMRKDMDDIGDFLEESDLFLQHPTEYDSRLEYLNPQYLLRPGSSVPRAHNAVFCAVTKQQPSDRMLEEKAKSEVHQVFDSACGPASFSHVKQSLRLKTNLQSHQQKALAMMVEKDCGLIDNTYFPCLWEADIGSDGAPSILRYRHVVTGRTDLPALVCGGVLADDMGLGKTLSTLALITWFLDLIDDDHLLEPCRTTLIVAPNSTIPGWQEQINRHIFLDNVNATLYHGPLRDQIANSLTSYDIVLTTYGTLQSEWKAKNGTSPLFSNAWARVVLDEAHHIRDRSTNTFKAAAALRTSRRWCLTGTPIQNRLDDYGSLLSFIGMPQLGNKSMFDHWVGKPVSQSRPEGLVRLKRLVRATCLRRTKSSVCKELNLPDRTMRECIVKLDEKDREVYDFFKKNASHLIAGMVGTGSNEASRAGNILPIINTLRLICNHGESLLPSSALRAWSQRYNPTVDSDLATTLPGLCYACGKKESPDSMPSEFTCSHTLCSDCANSDEGYQSSLDSAVCPRCTENFDSASDRAAVGMGDNYKPSAKVRALLENLHIEQQQNKVRTLGSRSIKSVVFTYWVRMLNLLEVALHDAGFGFQRIDGQKNLTERTSALRLFNSDDSCTVMIATIGSIGEGVDLTAANFVHLVEPHWNPMVEEQALDRVHRMGQTRDVVATRYITDNSIETVRPSFLILMTPRNFHVNGLCQFVRDVKAGKLQLINKSLGHLAAEADTGKGNLWQAIGMEGLW
ncbi:hypothetical protein F53441_12603 [Fusarium austroafricanum]|uniref:Uncharacterized protein n=1 Tax=Fusarium austroafricanum TaxID=2364996 RepID=A0A8H4NNE6_9HYPO|nr:hypothetical protein F53441_12603 [Fusarium austroafricanum]